MLKNNESNVMGVQQPEKGSYDSYQVYVSKTSTVENVGTRLQEFIESWDTPQNFAKALHNFAQAALLMHLQQTDSPYQKEIGEGYFYIGKMCEIIYPDADTHLIV